MSRKLFITADTHFNHRLLSEMREYKDIEAMNEDMIQTWNHTVKKNDIVYHLGDFGWGSVAQVNRILDRLNGEIHLILGNHDNRVKKNPPRYKFASVRETHMLKVPMEHEWAKRFNGNLLIWLSHYAHRVWPQKHYGALHLYGHSHGKLREDPNDLAMDVGWDVWAEPIPIGVVLTAFSVKQWFMRREGEQLLQQLDADVEPESEEDSGVV